MAVGPTFHPSAVLSVLAALENRGGIAADTFAVEAVEMMRENPKELLLRIIQPGDTPLMALFRFHNDLVGLHRKPDGYPTFMKSLLDKLSLPRIVLENVHRDSYNLERPEPDFLITSYFQHLATQIEEGARTLASPASTWQEAFQKARPRGLLEEHEKEDPEDLEPRNTPIATISVIAALERFGLLAKGEPLDQALTRLREDPAQCLLSIARPGETLLSTLFRLHHDRGGLHHQVLEDIENDAEDVLLYSLWKTLPKRVRRARQIIDTYFKLIVSALRKEALHLEGFPRSGRSWDETRFELLLREARSKDKLFVRFVDLIKVSEDLADAGYRDWALTVAGEVEALARLQGPSRGLFYLSLLAPSLHRSGFFQEAKELFEICLKESRLLEDPKDRAGTLEELAYGLESSEPEWSVEVAKEALRTAQWITDASERVIEIGRMAWMFLGRRGMFRQKKFFQETLDATIQEGLQLADPNHRLRVLQEFLAWCSELSSDMKALLLREVITILRTLHAPADRITILDTLRLDQRELSKPGPLRDAAQLLANEMEEAARDLPDIAKRNASLRWLVENRLITALQYQPVKRE